MFRFMKKRIHRWRLSASTAQILAVLAFAQLWEGSRTYNLDMQFPLVYEDPTENAGRGTYFGFSVIMYSSQGKNNTAWIQVGAPRANSSFNEHIGIREPGVVYRCSFWPPRPCKPMRLDRKGNEPSIGEGISYWDHKDGAWIGAAMDVQPSPGGRVVICGPRWINQLYKNNFKEYFQLGVCYWIPAEEDVAIQSRITDDDAEKLLPLLDEDRLQYSHISWDGASVYDFGVGEAGMSVHITFKNKTSELLLGAPGILNWRGGPILYRDGVSFIGGGLNKRSAFIGAFSQLTVPSPKTLLRFNEFEYLGYYVSSGNFYAADETLYVASAPRGMGIKGKVLLFTFNDLGSFEQNSIILKGRAVGIQFGEYFGASLAVGDLNNDGLDDLVVGAPLYAASSSGSTIGYDEGRVSVYLGSTIRRLIETQWIVGKVSGARFGSAVSYIGDMDSDGYAEVAIGAPYEDQGQGAVYIYPGNKEFGLSNQAVQHLKAQDIYPYLRGFGASISSHPADIDHNGCPGVWRTMEVDALHQRCHMKNGATSSDMIHLTKGKPYCESKEIMLKPNIQNYMNPIEVNIWYQLPEEKELQEIRAEKGNSEFKIQPILIKRNGVRGADNFCKDCPIPQGISKISISVPFKVECGKDNICHADLHITGILPQLSKSLREDKISYVIGSEKILHLKVLVSNKETAELAYLTRVHIELGDPARITRIPATCRETSQTSFLYNLFEFTKAYQKLSGNSSDQLFQSHVSKSASLSQFPRENKAAIYISCDLDNPLHPNSYREVLLELDVTNAQKSEGMQLRAWVTTSSNETNPFDNIWNLYLPFCSEADIAIDGTTQNEVQTFYKGNKESEEKINFMHVYQVEKFGHSPLEKVDVEFHIPSAIFDENKKKLFNFLTIKRLESKQDEQALTCKFLRRKKFSTFTLKTRENLPKTYHSNTNLKVQRREISILKIENSLNNTAIRGSPQKQSNFTFNLGCSSFLRAKGHRVECTTIKCDAGPFLNSLTVAQFFLHMELNVKTLYPFISVQRTISIATTGTVKVKEPENLKQPTLDKPDQAIISTWFAEENTGENLESWTVALSIATGMMIFLLLVTGLSKAGFFERRKKEELKEFKRELLLGEESQAD